MNADKELRDGIQKIQTKGWTQGTLEADDGSVCLVGALSVNYCLSQSIMILSDKIKSECEHCRLEEIRYSEIMESSGMPGYRWTPMERVYRHNDACLTSGEDAIMLMKEALFSIE